MAELSPAAQAVLDAAYALPLKNNQPSIAAALRAVAEKNAGSVFACHEPVVFVSRILAIATELENANA